MKTYTREELTALSDEEVLALPFVIPSVYFQPSGGSLDIRTVQKLQSDDNGSLKELFKDGAARLKRALMSRGFTFVFTIFVLPDGSEWLGDGHGRIALFEMQPPIDVHGNPIYNFPCNRYPAKNKRDAAAQLLEFTSQQNRVTQEGVDWFKGTFDMEDVEFDAFAHFDAVHDFDFDNDEKNASDDNYSPPDNLPVYVEPGDIVDIGAHKLLCASSTEMENWEKLMSTTMADMVQTDPPYNVDYVGNTKEALTIKNEKMSDSNFYQFLFDFYSAIGSKVKNGAAWYVWHADSEGHNFSKALLDAGVMVKQCLIWVKNTMVMGRQDYHSKHEPCLYGWKKGRAHNWYSDRKQTTVLEFDRPSANREHPTMKPVPLIAYQIENSSKEGDVIVDGFLGSGTTMVASHQLGRVCYGMELDPKYCQVVIDRMLNLDPSIEVNINGKPFEEVKAEKPQEEDGEEISE